MPFLPALRLRRLIEKIERLTARGALASSRLTRWRLAIFLAGAVTTITLYKSGWYLSGNSVLLAFVVLFSLVAAYHNRLEERIHRLRLWKTIKSVHEARLQLTWTAIPLRTSEREESHLYANDLDIAGPHSLLHLVDTTVSDHGRTRLTACA